jgi:DNA-binding response OmpR family regulator
MKQRLLVVEDDTILATVLHHNLTVEGYEVQCVNKGDVALTVAKQFSPDLVLLDVNLPGMTGFELCARWRAGWTGRARVPIIILTARGLKEDKLEGLTLGADDYVTKPFDLEELIARIKAVLRRSRPAMEQLHLGSTTIDLVGLKAWKGAKALELTQKEFELLQYFAERLDTLVYREELLKNVWGYSDSSLHTRAVDNAIGRLRKKIEADPPHPRFIHTVFGDGYYLTLGGTKKSHT